MEIRKIFYVETMFIQLTGISDSASQLERQINLAV